MSRTIVTQPPHFMVESAIWSINNKQNETLSGLDARYSTTNQWLEEAIESAKRKILENKEIAVSSPQLKKAKVAIWKKGGLSPIEDKENSPSVPDALPEQHKPQLQLNNAQVEYQKMKTMLKPPPSAVKRKVQSMKVVDLKKALKSRGQETKGLKKDLQTRLMEAYSTVEQIMSPKKPEKDMHATSQNTSTDKEHTSAYQNKEDENSVGESVEIVFESMAKGAVFDKDEDTPEASTDAKPAPTVEDTAIEMDEAKPRPSLDSQRDPSVTEAPIFNGDQETTTEMADVSRVSEMVIDGSVPNSFEETTSSSTAKDSVTDRVVPKEYLPSLSSTKSAHSNIDGSDDVSDDVSMMDCEQPERPSLGDRNSEHLPSVKLSIEAQPAAVGTSQVENAVEARDQERGEGTKLSETSSIESKNACDEDQTEQDEQKQLSCNQQQSTQGCGIRSPMKIFQTVFARKSPAKSPTKAASSPPKSSWLMKAKSDLKNVGSLVEEKFESSGQQKEETLSGKAIRVPGFGTSASKSQTTVSAATESRKVDAEARKARLAQMRAKSKPVVKPGNLVSKTLNIASTLKVKRCVTVDGKEGGKKLLTAQMREKAAAAARKEKTQAAPVTSFATKQVLSESTKAVDASQHITHHVAPTKSDVTASSLSETAVPSLLKSKSTEIQTSLASTKFQAGKPCSDTAMECSDTAVESSATSSSSTSVKIIAASSSRTKKTLQSPPPRADAVLMKKQLLSPLDTYEMSDREGSDSDSESDSDSDNEDDTKPRKKIPEWALKDNLIPALEKQFSSKGGRHDPDEIFSEVQTCDLQAIFNSKRARYTRRTSSGNWTKDKVTAAEKLTYKRTMGFDSKAAK